MLYKVRTTFPNKQNEKRDCLPQSGVCGHKGIIQMLFAVTNLDTGLQLYKSQRALCQTEGNTNESTKYHKNFILIAS
jgi:hypothetical protein